MVPKAQLKWQARTSKPTECVRDSPKSSGTFLISRSAAPDGLASGGREASVETRGSSLALAPGRAPGRGPGAGTVPQLPALLLAGQT